MFTTKNKSGMAMSVIMVFAMAFTMLVASASNVFATQAYNFHFRVEAHQANGHEPSPRYRGDVSPSNRWWVKLIKSGEGKGALTDFWLEARNGTNLSPSMRVQCGNGWYGQRAYASASNRKVLLTAEDNTDKPSGYTVSGRWQTQDD